MDSDPPKTARRKSRFRPKPPPPPGTPIIATPKIEEDGGDDLVRRFNEHLARRAERVEKKSSARVIYSLDKDFASTSIKSFGKQRERTDDEIKCTDDGSIMVYSEASVTGEKMENLVTSISAAERQGVADNSVDLTNTASVKKKKEYQEPWDYHQSDYPITLPIRRPYSGDPEVLDKAEFEEALEYDENSDSSASNLDLWPQDFDETHRMLFFKFPSNLPLGRQPTNASRRGGTDGNSTGIKGKEIVGSSSGYPLNNDDSLEELHEGYMGKMLVFKSGAVKLKLGDIMYEVSPTVECSFSQSVMAINVTDKQCCEIGDVSKGAVVTPDIDSLLDSEKD